MDRQETQTRVDGLAFHEMNVGSGRANLRLPSVAGLPGTTATTLASLISDHSPPPSVSPGLKSHITSSTGEAAGEELGRTSRTVHVYTLPLPTPLTSRHRARSRWPRLRGCFFFCCCVAVLTELACLPQGDKPAVNEYAGRAACGGRKLETHRRPAAALASERGGSLTGSLNTPAEERRVHLFRLGGEGR